MFPPPRASQATAGLPLQASVRKLRQPVPRPGAHTGITTATYTVQFALLNRSMRVRALAAINLASVAAGFAAAVFVAVA